MMVSPFKDHVLTQAPSAGRYLALRLTRLRRTGVVAPTPACGRALKLVVAALERDGHKVLAMFVTLIQ